MTERWEIIANQGFKFIGKMNASISHEIKNVLAIINENAGLLEDLAVMTEKGMTIDVERLKALARKTRKQVKRADTIITKMNDFAHSVDESKEKVNIGEILVFMAALSERLATMRGVKIRVVPPERPITITTNPFLLENIIWLCLDFAMDVAGKGKTVELDTEEAGKSINIRFAELKGLAETADPMFPADIENALLIALGGRIVTDQDAGIMVLALPKEIPR